MFEKKNIEVSIILPVFEESETIRDLVPELVYYLRENIQSFEVIVVEDGSKDSSLSVLNELMPRFPENLRVARHLYNKGNGASLRTGISVARGDIVVTMDADGQHAPEDISKLLDLIPPFDLVIGARTISYEGSWYRGLANRFFNKFSSWLSRHEIRDLTSGFRAMRRHQVLHFLPLFPSGFSAPTTTTMAFLKAGYNVTFVPIHVHQRKSGKSKINLWKDGYRFIIIILRMIMLFDPMRIFLPAGLLLGFLGLTAWVAGLFHAQRLVIPNSAILFFSSALLTWLLGLISDQLSSSRIQYQGDETVVMHSGDISEG
jgi:glycosyltransferase involved in cell wall biosynthesis